MTKDNTAEGKPKNLQEFIETTIDDVAIGMYCDENHSLSDELERNEHEIAEAQDIMKRFAPRLVSHLLEVAKEWCETDCVQYFQRHPDGSLSGVNSVQGICKCAQNLKEFLESYCAPVEDLKK